MMKPCFIVDEKMLSDLNTFLPGVVVLNLNNFIFLPFYTFFCIVLCITESLSMLKKTHI